MHQRQISHFVKRFAGHMAILMHQMQISHFVKRSVGHMARLSKCIRCKSVTL